MPYSSTEKTEEEYVRQDCSPCVAPKGVNDDNDDVAYTNVGHSNDGYVEGRSDDASSYTQQSNNGDYAMPQFGGKDFAVTSNTPPPYVIVAMDDEEYTKQESNGPHTVSSVGADYAKATFKEGDGYALESMGIDYAAGSKDDCEYIEVTNNGDYVHSE